jgi:hypothetical protein
MCIVAILYIWPIFVIYSKRIFLVHRYEYLCIWYLEINLSVFAWTRLGNIYIHMYTFIYIFIYIVIYLYLHEYIFVIPGCFSYRSRSGHAGHQSECASIRVSLIYLCRIYSVILMLNEWIYAWLEWVYKTSGLMCKYQRNWNAHTYSSIYAYMYMYMYSTYSYSSIYICLLIYTFI